ncbi:alpha-(1,3)-fucosyltransferase C-like isoform X2 [Arctopsyche grandis]|uniref:alpha-(1,3)-fucosyltransferase C-like isoform X2 n=1 Tax=Arctopsyche grandis TaxID=121162 RepID=UPI00406D7C7D
MQRRIKWLIAGVFAMIFWLTYSYNYSINTSLLKNFIKNDERLKDGVKNILMWTHNYTEPFNRFKNGRESFLEANCPINNCYITNNRSYLERVESWDAILFHAPEYTWRNNPWKHGMPSVRSPHQRYIFVSIESSANYPVDDPKWDGYFNWTMTYKTDSDVRWVYLAIRDVNENLVGPKPNIEWNIGDKDVSRDIKDEIKKKSKTAAWFVSNYIYGRCGNLKCPRDDMSSCWKMLKDDYLFYLSFENSFSEDYTTEKLLHAVLNDVVPIVMGGSDYSRFIPPNSYLDASSYRAEDLAKVLNDYMNNKNEYEKFFKWKNYYKYHSYDDSPETHQACLLCEALNKNLATKTYYNFREWWNGKKVNRDGWFGKKVIVNSDGWFG